MNNDKNKSVISESEEVKPNDTELESTDVYEDGEVGTELPIEAQCNDSVADKCDSEKVEPEKKEKKPRKKGDVSPARLIITLTVVCVVIALVLGGVNMITRDRIRKAAEAEKNEAILGIFPMGDYSELYATAKSDDEIYVVRKGNSIIGYCVFTAAAGFGGDIEMIVGIDTDYKTYGVKIIAMSETPGVGTKTNTLGFLDRFIGKSHTSPTSGVEAISGATISSNAVMEGVAKAHQTEFSIEDAAKKLGLDVVSPDSIKDEATETTPDKPYDTTLTSEKDTNTSETGSDVESSSPGEGTTGQEPTEETEDIPFVENGYRGNPIYGVNVETSFDRYVIEVTKETDSDGELILPTEETTTAPSLPTMTLPLITQPVTSESTSSPMGSVSLPRESTGELTSDPDSEEPSSEGTSESSDSESASDEPISPENVESGGEDPVEIG